MRIFLGAMYHPVHLSICSLKHIGKTREEVHKCWLVKACDVNWVHLLQVAFVQCVSLKTADFHSLFAKKVWSPSFRVCSDFFEMQIFQVFGHVRISSLYFNLSTCISFNTHCLTPRGMFQWTWIISSLPGCTFSKNHDRFYFDMFCSQNSLRLIYFATTLCHCFHDTSGTSSGLIYFTCHRLIHPGHHLFLTFWHACLALSLGSRMAHILICLLGLWRNMFKARLLGSVDVDDSWMTPGWFGARTTVLQVLILVSLGYAHGFGNASQGWSRKKVSECLKNHDAYDAYDTSWIDRLIC